MDEILQKQLRDMPPPTAKEIADWADGIVYGKTPGGVDVYFDKRARAWRRVRELGPGKNSHWPRDDED